MTHDKDRLLSFYHRMLMIRQFEERVKMMFLEGIMPGTIHQCQGQEASAVGVCFALNEKDVITSTHRPHGHAIARGLSVESLMHELFGKSTGCCKAKGGSMHVGDLDQGMVPAIAIVAGNIPLATGIALSYKMRREPHVAVSFMGDGAINEGAFHEAVNMGAIWKLPVLFVCENNQYAMSTRHGDISPVGNAADRAAAYAMTCRIVDGNDVVAVHETAAAARAAAAAAEGPVFIELQTYRISGHSRGDECPYRSREEEAQWAERDPIVRLRQRLAAAGLWTDAADTALETQLAAELAEAEESARQS